ncbi:head-tail connector protein [Pseudogemmobacter faecipullorum]|nr:head-tail connector protein [Pseudogemmobacter faecipullorum]
MMLIEQAGEPVGEVLSRNDAKAHCRASDFDDDDTLIEGYILAAAEYVQDVCQTILLRTPFKATGPRFNLGFTGFPRPELSSVSYVDDLGATITVDPSQYEICKGRLVVHGVTSITSATVEFTAGIGAGNVPAKLVQAARMMVAHWYANREASGEGLAPVPLGVRDMVALHRSFAF